MRARKFLAQPLCNARPCCVGAPTRAARRRGPRGARGTPPHRCRPYRPSLGRGRHRSLSTAVSAAAPASQFDSSPPRMPRAQRALAAHLCVDSCGSSSTTAAARRRHGAARRRCSSRQPQPVRPAAVMRVLHCPYCCGTDSPWIAAAACRKAVAVICCGLHALTRHPRSRGKPELASCKTLATRDQLIQIAANPASIH